MALEVLPGGVVAASGFGDLYGLGPDGTLTLRVFLDHSVIEVYANRTACITGRIYPSRLDSLGIDVFAEGGGVRLSSLDTWQMASIW